MNNEERKTDWVQRLGKWRTVMTGRIIGTRPNTDPQAQGFRDLFDKANVLRAAVNAVTALLIKKGVFTAEEYTRQLQEEAKWLCEQYEKQFPGFKATDYGLDVDTLKASQTTKGWQL